MIGVFSSFSRLGYRRVFFLINIFLVCKIKSWAYRVFFSEISPVLNGAKILQPTQFLGRGYVYVGCSQIGVWSSPGLISCAGYIEARSKEARVVISDSTSINNNFTMIADRSSITIGERCLIGQNFFVCDSDFHGVNLANRLNGGYECAPVVIESDVFIGEGVRVLKGVRVGKGSVIGSGSVVVNDVEPYSIYAGVPAKKIREIPIE